MKKFLILTMVAGSLFASKSFATGLATCDSGDPAGWQSKETLQAKLEAQGWEVRRIKEDGGCWEAYARDADGKRVEAYFHPVTLEPMPIDEDSESDSED